MGFLARMFGIYSPEERVDRARRFLDRGEANEARIELEGLEGPEAEALRAEALAALVARNLQEAEARFVAGDEQGGEEHMAMAKQFGASAEDLRAVRRTAREARAERRKAEAARKQAAEVIEPEGDDALWSLPPSDPRIRFAMLLEAWPAELQERLAGLGREYAEAVLLLEDGRPEEAWEALSAWVGREPAVRYERARAAIAMGQHVKAASDLESFGDAVGHQRIGGTHTAVLLAQLRARTGDLQRALDVIDAELARGADPSMMATRASLLEAMGRLDEAAELTSQVIQQVPKDLGLYRMLGRIRLRQGDRLGAMQVLEAGMRVGKCESPGKCGYRPPDVESLRMLARLYLEDRRDPKRAREIVGLLANMVQQPTWDDAYIAALAARNDDSPGLPEMVDRLRAGLPPGDPRLELLASQFGQPRLSG
ncbi:MAG: hypothetical protein D6798_09455 [Deltaproteobacteria bacterium]|nr:MAG: hypothetical protein D6798_09455 [Deltaproteobacteria bacterium]